MDTVCMIEKTLYALARSLGKKTRDDEAFCRKWAGIESRDYVFYVRRECIWEKPWRIEFYDLHRWNGHHIHWNGWDVESGEGTTLEEAWEDMAKKIFLYEGASSKESAIIKAELAMRKDLPRGWGRIEWRNHFGLLTPAAHQQGEKT